MIRLQLDPSTTSSSIPVQIPIQTQEQKDVIEAAIEGHKSETPFGDLSDVTGNVAGDGLSVQALSEIYPDDFRPRDLDTGEEPAEEDAEEGHDIPITMALSPTPNLSPASVTTAGVATQGTGKEGSLSTSPKERVSAIITRRKQHYESEGNSAETSQLFQQGEDSSSSGSEEEENEEDAAEKEGQGRGRTGVREARVRSVLEDEDGE